MKKICDVMASKKMSLVRDNGVWVKFTVWVLLYEASNFAPEENLWCVSRSTAFNFVGGKKMVLILISGKMSKFLIIVFAVCWGCQFFLDFSLLNDV